MKISFAMLMDAIKQYNPEIIHRTDNISYVDKALILTGADNSVDKNSVYVAEKKVIEEIIASKAQLNPYSVYLVPLECRDVCRELGPSVICADYSDCFYSFYNCITNYMYSMNRWSDRLNSIIRNYGSIGDLIDCADAVFEGFFMAWDQGFNVVAYSSSKTIDSYIINKCVKQHAFPSRYISKVIESGKLADPTKKELITRGISLFDDKYKEYIHHCFASGRRSYSIALFSKEEINDATLDLLEYFFRKADGFLGALGEEYLSEHDAEAAFIEDLITGNLVDSIEIEKRVAKLGLDVGKRYAIFVVNFERFSKDKADIFIAKMLKHYPAWSFLIYDEKVVWLSCGERRFLIETFREDMREALSACRAKCGVSNFYFDLSETRYAYLQALTALRLGPIFLDVERPEVTGGWYSYVGVSVYNMFEIYRKDNTLLSLVNNELKQFFYDEMETGGNNIQFLKEYFNNGMSVSKMANDKYLHRNSVRYKLNQLEAKYKINFESMESLLRIMLLIKIYDFYQQYNK